LILNEEFGIIKFNIIVDNGIDGEVQVIIKENDNIISNLYQAVIVGKNQLLIQLNNRKCSIELITKTFNPFETLKSSDTRDLGIRILDPITLYQGDEKISISINNISSPPSKHICDDENDANEVYKLFPNTHFIHSSSGKLNLKNQWAFSHHRSGWKYVLKTLGTKLHNDNGIIFDTTLDSTFGVYCNENKRIFKIPYKFPWVGLFHIPPQAPSFYTNTETPSAIFANDIFQQSLESCMGLYVLSEYHAKFLRCLIKNVPVEVLYHPTEFIYEKFNFSEFLANSQKKVIHIGMWLRKLTSIYRLKIDKTQYSKINLQHLTTDLPDSFMDRVMNIEKNCISPTTDEEMGSVTRMGRVSNSEYDTLISQNIIFIDLYDASANNIVIECIARNTPLLINPLPAVIEYLGIDYPFYFNSLEEASQKLHDFDLIRTTHEYLLNWTGAKKLTDSYFIDTITNGDIYKSL
jgi:hypothetical protein